MWIILWVRFPNGLGMQDRICLVCILIGENQTGINQYLSFQSKHTLFLWNTNYNNELESTNSKVLKIHLNSLLIHHLQDWKHHQKMSKVLSHEESESIFKKLRSNPANKVGNCSFLFANVLGVFWLRAEKPYMGFYPVWCLHLSRMLCPSQKYGCAHFLCKVVLWIKKRNLDQRSLMCGRRSR